MDSIEREASVIEVPGLSYTSVAGVNGMRLELSVPELSIPQPTYNPQDPSSQNLPSPNQQIRQLETTATASELP